MTPRSLLERGLEQLALKIPAPACEKLLSYVELLAKWNRTYNLTAIREPSRMVTHHLLDSLGTGAEERAARGDAGVADEEVDAGMTLEHALRRGLDGLAVADVAFLVLVSLRAPSGQADHEHAPLLQGTRELGADPGRRAGDDRYLQTRTLRPAVAAWPAASTSFAARWCVPFFSVPVFQATE